MKFMERSIWLQEDFNKSQPVSDELIKLAEEQLGITLPKTYIKLLKEQNGGSIIFNAYPAPDHEIFNDTSIEVDYIEGIGKDDGILKSEEMIEEWEMPKGLVLFNGDGHFWLAFDYRHTISNPPIVYVDNTDEVTQVIKIAENFDEFLDRLYVAEIELPDDDEEYYFVSYSKEDFELLIKQNDVEKLSEIIWADNFEEDVELDWYAEKLLQLSKHPNDDVRIATAHTIWNFYANELSDELLGKFIELFKNDSDSEVRSYADMILTQLNYSLDDLKKDMIEEDTGYGTVEVCRFRFRENSYFVIKKENKWVLESHVSSAQLFDSIDHFFKDATLEGIPLTNAWSEVKKM